MTTDDERSVTTEATTREQPHPAGSHAAPPPRRLVRLDQGAPFAGVAAGLGAYYGVDPVLLRIAFVVLAFAGGIGLVLYVACWIAMPAGTPDDVRGAPPAPPERTSQWVAVGLLVLVGLVLVTQMPFWAPWPVSQALLTAGVLIVLGIVLFRWDASRRESGSPAAPPAASLPAAPPPHAAGAAPSSAGPAPGAASPGAGTAPPSAAPSNVGAAPPGARAAPPGVGAAPPGAGPPPSAAPPAYAPQPQPGAAEPKGPSSVLGRLAAGAGLLVLGVAALLDNAGALHLGAHHYVALALTVTGLALLVGAWWGRARGLIAVGLLLVPVLAVTSVLGALSGGSAEVGDRFYAPATAAEAAEPFRLLAGELHVDLRALEEPAVVDAAVVAGDLLVIVPHDVNLVVEGSVGAGELDLPDRVIGGLNVSRAASFDADPGAVTHEIEARAGFGRVRVLRADALGPSERFLP